MFLTICYTSEERRGVHHAVVDAVDTRFDVEQRQDLYNNIVLAGGTTMLPGMQERLQKELILLGKHQARVLAPLDRNVSSWSGGSILASLSTFQPMWISKEEYEEEGPAVVHRKCF
jgi:actin